MSTDNFGALGADFFIKTFDKGSAMSQSDLDALVQYIQLTTTILAIGEFTPDEQESVWMILERVDVATVPDYTVTNNTDVTMTSGGLVTINSMPWSKITNKPTFFDGSYSNLTGAPTIPTDVSDLTDITGLLNNSDLGDFTFSAGTASLPAGGTMVLDTVQDGGNKQSTLTLSTSTISSLDVGNNLRIRVGNGTGFEKDWILGSDGSLRFPDASVQSTAYTGSYNDLTDTPTIPSLDGYATESWVNSQGFGSSSGATSLSGLADVSIEGPFEGSVLTWNDNQSRWENRSIPSSSEITNTDGNSTWSVSVSETGIVTMTTARGTLEFGAQPEEGAPQHFHIMRPAGQEGSTDLYLGDDYNYVKLPGSYGAGSQGVVLGANNMNGGNQHIWSFDTSGNLTLPAGGDIKDSTGTSVLGGGSASTGDVTFSGGTLSNAVDNTVRLQTQDLNQIASYNFTPQGGDYSTAVWDGQNIIFNDPTQAIYDAIWALTSVSVVEVQVASAWYTVTYSGSTTPGMPAAPTLFVSQTSQSMSGNDGSPLSIDNVQITINQGTTSYAEVDGTDFRVDVQDDIRMYANDIFVLGNRGIGESIRIETNDGEHTWFFNATGNLQLPSGGDIVDSNGASVLSDGGTTLPADASGYLNNDGAGTLTWVPGNPSGSGLLPYNGVTVLSNTTTADWTEFTLSGTMDSMWDYNNTVASITLSSATTYGRTATPNTKNMWVVDAKVNSNDYLVIEFPANPTPGDVFTVTSIVITQTVNAGSFVVGESYTITNVGDTNWTSIGAQYSGLGQTFVATGAGSGTGTATTPVGAKKLILKPATGQRARTMSTGQNGPVMFGQGGTYDFMFLDYSSQNVNSPITWAYAGVIDGIPTWYHTYF